MVIPQRLAKRLAFLLKTKRQHRGVAAECRRTRACGKSVGHDDAVARRLGEMNMAVDAARQDQPVRRVNDRFRRPEIVAKRRDSTVTDGDVARERVGGGCNRAAANDGIERH